MPIETLRPQLVLGTVAGMTAASLTRYELADDALLLQASLARPDLDPANFLGGDSAL